MHLFPFILSTLTLTWSLNLSLFEQWCTHWGDIQFNKFHSSKQPFYCIVYCINALLRRRSWGIVIHSWNFGSWLAISNTWKIIIFHVWWYGKLKEIKIFLWEYETFSEKCTLYFWLPSKYFICQASRCVQDLEVPHFYHELIFEVCTTQRMNYLLFWCKVWVEVLLHQCGNK